MKRGLLDAAISLSASKSPQFQVRRLCEPDLFVALSRFTSWQHGHSCRGRTFVTKSSSFARMALGVSSLAYSGAWWAPETERFNSIQQVS